METKLTKKEIVFLDMLCERWEKEQEERNRGMFIKFYKQHDLKAPKLKDYSAIPFEILKRDFVGTKFRNIWHLFTEICAYYPGIRLQLAQGTIVLVHSHGPSKSMVLSIIQKGKSWTYKRYPTVFHFQTELRERELRAEKVPYSKIFSVRQGKRILLLTKEEHGGIDLLSLGSIANKEEREILLQVTQSINLPAKPNNITYNPATKKFYVVDAG